jgi:hypothetical protein
VRGLCATSRSLIWTWSANLQHQLDQMGEGTYSHLLKDVRPAVFDSADAGPKLRRDRLVRVGFYQQFRVRRRARVNLHRGFHLSCLLQHQFEARQLALHFLAALGGQLFSTADPQLSQALASIGRLEVAGNRGRHAVRAAP